MNNNNRQSNFIFGFMLWIFLLPAYAESPKVVTILYDKHSSALGEFHAALNESLPQYKIYLQRLNEEIDPNSIVVAIGQRVLRHLLDNSSTQSILTTFISSLAYHDLIKQPILHSNVTALYLDPSPDKQLRLIKGIYKRNASVAVLISNRSQYLYKYFLRLGKRHNLPITIENIDESGSLFKALAKVSNSKVLLAIPDAEIYNLRSFKNILRTTYRHNQAVVGYSNGMVKAGALASASTTISDVAIQLATMIKSYSANNKLPNATFSRNYDIQVNKHVAKSLNLPEITISELIKIVNSPTTEIDQK